MNTPPSLVNCLNIDIVCRGVLPSENRQGTYMELQVNNTNPAVQQYATIINPGAVVYDEILVARNKYMELSKRQEDEQKYSKLSGGYEELGR